VTITLETERLFLQDYAFDQLSLNRVVAFVDREDEAGRKLAETLGMELQSDEGPLVYGIREEQK